MALEALKRNGHNLELGLFPLDGPFGIPRLVPAYLNDRIPWIPFNSVMSDRRKPMEYISLSTIICSSTHGTTRAATRICCPAIRQ